MRTSSDLDLDLARAGYLRCGRQVRHVSSLDSLMADIQTADVRIEWAELPAWCPGYCRRSQRVIVLARWLLSAFPFLVRRVLAHELAHCLIGSDEEAVREWVRCRYQEATEPPEWV